MGISREITERYRAQKQLERIYRFSNAVSRARAVQDICVEALEGMRESLNADRSAIVLLDESGVMRFTHWSDLSEGYRKAMEGLSPWPRDAEDPRPIVVSDVEGEPSLAAFQDTIRGEGIQSLAFIPLAYEGRLLGRVMIYYNAPHQFRDDEVQLAQSVASHVAFTIEHKRAEQALMESEDRYRTLVELSPEAILVHAGGRILYANSAAAKLLNAANPEEIVGRPLLDLVHQDSQEAIAQHAQQIEREGRVRNSAEATYMRATGEQITLEVSSAPMVYGGKAARLAFLRNVTERKRAEQSIRLLAEMDTVLAGSLDYEATLRHAAHLAVPAFADWCAVDLVDESGKIWPATMANSDLDREKWARDASLRFPPIPGKLYGTASVVRTGKPELYPDIPDSVLVALARDEEHLAALRSVGMISAIVLPIKARGRILGAILFIMPESGRRYVESDLAVAEQVAYRIDLAVNNAQLYQQAEEQRANLKMTLDSIAEGVISVNQYLQVERANHYALTILRTEEESLKGKPVREALSGISDHGDEGFDLEDFIKGCIAEQEIRSREDLWLKTNSRGLWLSP
jgi:PAS domain S-box-containing protein